METQEINMTLIQVTARGEQHGLLKKLANSVQGDGFKHMTPENKAKAERQKKEDMKIVKARYLNSRGQHERLSRPWTAGAGEPIEMWHFIPGNTYDIPKGLVDDVNSKRTIARAGKCDANGENPLDRDTVEEPLHQFVPVAF
jgi:hypothetical protein